MKLSTEEKRFPKLECIIAIDDGVVLGMKWCPLGGSTDNTKVHRCNISFTDSCTFEI